jgi:uncharacterized membrane protein YfcA
MTNIIFIAIGVVIGVLSGIVGLGGGILVVPVLRYFFGYSQTMAQGTSVAMLLPPIGILAAYQYWRHGQMNILVALLLAAGFIVGGYFGGMIAVKLPVLTLQRIFGAFLLIVALKMLISK